MLGRCTAAWELSRRTAQGGCPRWCSASGAWDIRVIAERDQQSTCKISHAQWGRGPRGGASFLRGHGATVTQLKALIDET